MILLQNLLLVCLFFSIVYYVSFLTQRNIKKSQVKICSDELCYLLEQKGFYKIGDFITHDEVKEWLLETHKLYISIFLKEENGKYYYIMCGKNIPFKRDKNNVIIDPIIYNPQETEEKCFEYGIKYILEKLL